MISHAGNLFSSLEREFMIHNYGTTFREMREAVGLTQSQVGKALGFTTSQFISNIEAGKAAPPITMIAPLVVIYNTTTATFRDILRNIRVDEVDRKFETVKVTNEMRSKLKKKIKKA